MYRVQCGSVPGPVYTVPVVHCVKCTECSVAVVPGPVHTVAVVHCVHSPDVEMGTKLCHRIVTSEQLISI